jgi:two-component system chemotaxis sensor kinase CheA
MTIFTRLALAFGAVVTTFALTGVLIFSNLKLIRASEATVREQVHFNEVALEYRHSNQQATLGAAQLASGNPLGEQRIREGLTGMARSLGQLKLQKGQAISAGELRELARVSVLTIEATKRVAALVQAKSTPLLIQQELAFQSARADALNIRLEALFDESQEQVALTMNLSDKVGERVQRQTAYAITGCIAFSILVSLLVFRSIAKPLAKLDEGVRKISDGDLKHVIAETSNDEIGQLTKAFNGMTRGLRQAMSALDQRNQDMRVVLDNVNQGLLMMGKDGLISAERSAVVGRWLGELSQEQPLWEQLAPVDERFAGAFKGGWEQVIDDILPLELTLDQMPKKTLVGERQLELEYLPIMEGDGLSKLLIVVSDITERLASEKARAHDQEVMAIFQAVQRDRHGFLGFFSEGSELVSALSGADALANLTLIKRQLHTLKGNSLIFGIGSVAHTCHELETALGEPGELESAADFGPLCARWEELARIVAELVGDSSARIEIDDDEYAAILEAIVKGRPRREIAQMVANWRMEPAQLRLNRFAAQARQLAQRLDKNPLEVKVDGNGMRLPRERFAPFWNALVHAVRNAVDHGIESASERSELNKGPALIELRTVLLASELRVEIADNGRGIAWERIAEKARRQNLPHETEEDLVNALFSDGISTADTLSEVSGRGVGMAALRDACAELAGKIVIDSAAGAGTCLSFRFPIQVARDETVIEFSTAQIAASMVPVPAGLSSMLPRMPEQRQLRL